MKLKEAIKEAAVKYGYTDVLAQLETSTYFYTDGYATPGRIRNHNGRRKKENEM